MNGIGSRDRIVDLAICVDDAITGVNAHDTPAEGMHGDELAVWIEAVGQDLAFAPEREADVIARIPQLGQAVEPFSL